MARQLVIELVGEAAKFVKSLDDAGNSTKSFGDKVTDGGKKLTAFVSVPIIGFLGAATKAAADDAAAQEHLAKTLVNVGETHKNVLPAVNGYIEGAMKASTFTDDELRPAFESLVLVTGSAEQSMNLMDIAMDVAAGKGISLETATLAVAKAHEGNFAAVNKLIPGLIDMNDKTMTADKAQKILAETFSGQASAATETAAGKTQMMTRDLGEMTESIGGALIPIITQLLGVIRPIIDRFMEMDEKTQKIIVIVGLAVAAIGPMIGVVTALGTAMAFLAANPIVLIIAGIVALGAALVIAYQKCETFRNIVQAVFGWIVDHWPLLVTVAFGPIGLAIVALIKNFDSIKDVVQSVWNFIKPILDKIGGAIQAVAGPLGTVLKGAGSIIGKIPGFANGGYVGGGIGSPHLAVVHGGEQILPYRGGQVMGSSSGGGTTIIQVVVDGQVITESVHKGLLDKQGRSGNLGFEAA